MSDQYSNDPYVEDDNNPMPIKKIISKSILTLVLFSIILVVIHVIFTATHKSAVFSRVYTLTEAVKNLDVATAADCFLPGSDTRKTLELAKNVSENPLLGGIAKGLLGIGESLMSSLTGKDNVSDQLASLVNYRIDYRDIYSVVEKDVSHVTIGLISNDENSTPKGYVVIECIRQENIWYVADYSFHLDEIYKYDKNFSYYLNRLSDYLALFLNSKAEMG